MYLKHRVDPLFHDPKWVIVAIMNMLHAIFRSNY